eukprot:Unigene5416_Nuclearia_a/m.16589 Unigene5416_Nuclearia_a/g.16589  ORF Unigene5416_Nuclearia_a/g.16589 Unigene5416_Nuclearia_a/m.16589 type:complete len:359 (+) Unigene5416_Nuclearia_a:515-1591(+)
MRASDAVSTPDDQSSALRSLSSVIGRIGARKPSTCAKAASLLSCASSVSPALPFSPPETSSSVVSRRSVAALVEACLSPRSSVTAIANEKLVLNCTPTSVSSCLHTLSSGWREVIRNAVMGVSLKNPRESSVRTTTSSRSTLALNSSTWLICTRPTPTQNSERRKRESLGMLAVMRCRHMMIATISSFSSSWNAFSASTSDSRIWNSRSSSDTRLCRARLPSATKARGCSAGLGRNAVALTSDIQRASHVAAVLGDAARPITSSSDEMIVSSDESVMRSLLSSLASWIMNALVAMPRLMPNSSLYFGSENWAIIVVRLRRLSSLSGMDVHSDWTMLTTRPCTVVRMSIEPVATTIEMM